VLAGVQDFGAANDRIGSPRGTGIALYRAHDGQLVFAHACKLGLEGIVSKRRESFYSSGRSPHWIKTKNPEAPAVKREAEEDWGGWSARPRRSR